MTLGVSFPVIICDNEPFKQPQCVTTLTDTQFLCASMPVPRILGKLLIFFFFLPPKKHKARNSTPSSRLLSWEARTERVNTHWARERSLPLLIHWHMHRLSPLYEWGWGEAGEWTLDDQRRTKSRMLLCFAVCSRFPQNKDNCFSLKNNKSPSCPPDLNVFFFYFYSGLTIKYLGLELLQ